jgi:hypothetical protein
MHHSDSMRSEHITFAHTWLTTYMDNVLAWILNTYNAYMRYWHYGYAVVYMLDTIHTRYIRYIRCTFVRRCVRHARAQVRALSRDKYAPIVLGRITHAYAYVREWGTYVQLTGYGLCGRTCGSADARAVQPCINIVYRTYVWITCDTHALSLHTYVRHACNNVHTRVRAVNAFVHACKRCACIW